MILTACVTGLLDNIVSVTHSDFLRKSLTWGHLRFYLNYIHNTSFFGVYITNRPKRDITSRKLNLVNKKIESRRELTPVPNEVYRESGRNGNRFAFEGDRPPQQKALAALVYARKIKALLQSSARMRIFRENMTLPEAKTWVQCRPSKALRTLIKPQHLPTWMKYFVKYLFFNVARNIRVCSVMRSWIYTMTTFSVTRGEPTESCGMALRSAS